MVDRKARDQFAELLRHFIAGQMTNEKFENQIPLPKLFSSKPADPAIAEIWWIAALPFYGDAVELTLTGEYRVTDDERREIAQCVLFLKTDQEYQWPRPNTLKGLLMDLLYLISLGRAGRHANRDLLDAAAGDLEAWPFISLKALETARKKPPYLAGQKSLNTDFYDENRD